jgi:hypothetical protein
VDLEVRSPTQFDRKSTEERGANTVVPHILTAGKCAELALSIAGIDPGAPSYCRCPDDSLMILAGS